MWRFPVFLSVAGFIYVRHNLPYKSHQRAGGVFEKKKCPPPKQMADNIQFNLSATCL